MKVSKLLAICLGALCLGVVCVKDVEKRPEKHVRRFQVMNNNMRTYGTGFNIEYKGKFFVITNDHVCAVSKKLKYGNKALVNGKVLKIKGTDGLYDLCALEADTKDGLPLATKDLEPLDKVVLIGHPLGMDLIRREGAIVSKNKIICVGGYTTGTRCRLSHSISAMASPGNSGSPVLNSYGEVIGVLYAGAGTYAHVPYIVPYKYLKNFLERLVNEKR